MATILLATMDSTLFGSLSAEIAGEGHTVIWASDGKDAYDLTREHEADAVFLEEDLPVFGGFEVVELLRGDPDVPAALPVFLVSNDAPEPHRFERSGFTGRFPKNHSYFELRELLAAHASENAVVW